MKRDEPSGSSSSAADKDVKTHLGKLADAVSWGAERRAEGQVAEGFARASLIQKVLSKRPRDCFTPEALAAFKKKHIAMMGMSREPAETKAPPPPPGPGPVKAPPQGVLPSQLGMMPPRPPQ